jgi:tRNA (adenine37-N6)-methyltransferase
MLTVVMTPIGTVRSTRTTTEDDHWDSVVSSIELDLVQFTTDALAALDTFSHIEVVYLFDRVEGLRIRVIELDAVEGTPVLDIKPWVREFGPRSEVRQPAWMTELMSRYWVESPTRP